MKELIYFTKYFFSPRGLLDTMMFIYYFLEKKIIKYTYKNYAKRLRYLFTENHIVLKNDTYNLIFDKQHKYNIPIILPTHSTSITDISSYKENFFPDREDFESLHRFNWVRYYLSKEKIEENDKKSLESCIEHWCKYYIIINPINTSLMWSSYTNSERIINIVIYYLNINRKPSDVICYSLDVMAHNLINNLECYNQKYGNHLINNFRALLVYGMFSNNTVLVKDMCKHLEYYLSNFIINGFTKDYSSHYHLLMYFWLYDLSRVAEKYKYTIIINILKKFLTELDQKMSTFLVDNNFLILGDISPDYPIKYLLTLRNNEKYLNLYSLKNLYRRL